MLLNRCFILLPCSAFSAPQPLFHSAPLLCSPPPAASSTCPPLDLRLQHLPSSASPPLTTPLPPSPSFSTLVHILTAILSDPPIGTAIAGQHQAAAYQLLHPPAALLSPAA